MIFPNYDQKLAPIYMQMTLVFPTNIWMLKKKENVLNKDFSSLCQWFISNKLSIPSGEDKTKSILFSKASFRGYQYILCGPFH